MQKIILFFSLLIITLLSVNHEINAQITSDPLGTGTSSSATRGPFQRSDSGSSSVHSRANMVYTQAEIATTLGISAGSTITQINWDLGSTNQITASGNAVLNIYMKNSAVTEASAGFWADIIEGQNLVGTYTFNTDNNFPGEEGFMAFSLDNNFVYEGNSIEIAVEWDCSSLVAADANEPNLLFSGNGSLNWHWSATEHTSVIYRAGSSSPPSELTAGSRLKAERVNTQFVYVLPGSCGIPANLSTTNITTTTADLSWDAVTDASSYNWTIVAAGAGAGGTAIAAGTSENTTASATGLGEFTSYDLHVQADCGGGALSLFSAAYNFTTASSNAQTSASLGDGTSSSATRGPFQRSDSGSSSVYSRANLVYTKAELVAALGIGSGSTITQINWDLGSTNQITASGNAILKVYMKNSEVTEATAGFWTDIVEGQNLVGTYTFNLDNNFPGEEGFIAFPLATNFVYTGESVEIAVEWDCSGLVPADPDMPNLLLSGNGSLNWHWSPTAHTSVIYRAGSSSPPSELTAGSRLKAERVNTQFVFVPSDCVSPTNLSSSNLTATTADLSWDAADGINSYFWKVVVAGDGSEGTAVASGTAMGTTATATGLTSCTTYDFYVQSDCGDGTLTEFSALHSFTPGTPCIATPFSCDGVALVADTNEDTYDLITSVLAEEGGNPIEAPDCSYPEFGRHIRQEADPDLGKDAFVFYLFVDENDDRCINFDRQRNEIKTYNNSPDNLLGVLGETVQYKWKFKLDEGFQPSSKFTHIHQLKSVGASNNEDDMPQVTFTLRKGTPDQFELRYAEDLSQITWAQTDLTPFKGVWVEATETVTYGDWGEGVYDLVIKRVSDDATLFSYSNDNTRMWKTDATFVRPKWGIYRSLENAEDLRDEQVRFADFCIDELSATADCPAPPANVNAASVGFFTANLKWNGVPGASFYHWKVVEAGAGQDATAVAEGTSVNTTLSLTDLTDNTSYDLYVEADCGEGNTTGFSAAYNFTTREDTGEITTSSLGTETSSSSSRGPIHQAGTGASTRYSRFYHVFTREQLTNVGLVPSSSITQLQWYITTSDVITGAGEAPIKIYIKNSSATAATEGSWSDAISDATLVLDKVFTETDNFLGEAGWMPFALDESFEYTGGALEIGVEFNWASVAFTNNGTIKWRYSNYPDNVMVRALATAADGDYKDNMTLSSTGNQRANMRVVYVPTPVPCPAPDNLNTANITINSSDLSWAAVEEASAYNWKVVEGGAGIEGTAVAEGTTEGTMATASDLTDLTSYDLHVQTDCGDGELSAFSAAHAFVTLPAARIDSITLGNGVSNGSAIGPIHQGGAEANTRYSRFNQVFTQEELLDAGLADGDKITELQWFQATTDVISVGQAPLKVYIKNSDVTEATPVDWFAATRNLEPVVDMVLSETNNFLSEPGWMPFTFDEPFTYTGGALEVLVEWSWEAAAFTNDGKVRWNYTFTGINTVVRALGSGSHSNSNLSFSTSTSSPPNHRANMKIVYVPSEFVDNVNNSEAMLIKIYPNPVTGALTIEDFTGEVTLYNLLGQPLKAFSVTRQKQQLPLGDLHTGVYLLEMKDKDGAKWVQQIVKVEE